MYTDKSTAGYISQPLTWYLGWVGLHGIHLLGLGGPPWNPPTKDVFTTLLSLFWDLIAYTSPQHRWWRGLVWSKCILCGWWLWLTSRPTVLSGKCGSLIYLGTRLSSVHVFWVQPAKWLCLWVFGMDTCVFSSWHLWRNRLARSAVNRKVAGSNPARCVFLFFFLICCASFPAWERD